MNAPKKKSKPKLETRIKRWNERYQQALGMTHASLDDQQALGMTHASLDDLHSEAAGLLAEYQAKELKKKSKNPGKNSRTKGQKFQCEVARKLAPVWPHACSGSQYRGGSKDGCDVERTDYYVEAKNQKTLAIPAWWKKVWEDRDEAKDKREPALVFRVPRGKGNKVDEVVAVTLEHFIELNRWCLMKDRVEERRIDGVVDRWQVVDREKGLMHEFSGRIFLRVVDGKTFYEATLADHSIVYNDDKRISSNGLWSTLDDAEAAVRREWEARNG